MTGWPDHSRAAGSSGPVRVDVTPELPRDDTRYGDARLVGAGGMGRVESVFDRALDRVVARKTVLDGGDPGLGARLVREARIAARLDHPGIVAVHDVGTDAEGRPWYTMRLIRGSGLDAVVAETGGTEARLALVPRVLAAAQAVAYAHSVGVIHRDLKPSNVMIGPFGETQVVDWGLARALDDPTPDEVGLSSSTGPDLTTLGEVVGTPRWMSPEQARGEPADRRSDVYALGGILAWLVGDGDEVPRDLRAIVGRASATLPDDRYPDAGALAADLEAWLGGRRVSAHTYTARELAERVWRAWRFPLSVVGVAGLTLLTGLTVAFTRASAERDRALSAEHSLAGQLAASDVALAEAALTAADPLTVRAHAWDALGRRDLPGARALLSLTGGLTPALVRDGPPIPLSCEDVRLSPRGGAAACVSTASLAWLDARTGAVRWTGPGTTGGVGFRREGGELVRVERDGTYVHGPDGQVERRLGVVPQLPPQPAPEGVRVAVTNNRDLTLVGDDGVVHRVGCPGEDVLSVLTLRVDGGWAASCSAGRILLGRGTAVTGSVSLTHRDEPLLRIGPLAELPDGGWVVGTLDGRTWQAPAAGGEVRPLGSGTDDDDADRRAWGGGGLVGLRLSPDGRHLLVSSESGPPRVVRVDDGVVVASLPADTLRAVWVDDTTLRAVSRTELATWRLVAPEVAPRRTAAGLASVAWSPDGTRLAVGAGDGTVEVASARGREVAWASGVGVVKGVAWHPDGLFAVGTAVVWHPWTGDDVVLAADLASRQVARRADGTVVIASWSQWLWRATPAAATATESVPGPMSVSGDDAGLRTLMVGTDPWLRVLDEGAPRLLVDGPDQGRATLSGDGRVVAAVVGDEARVLDAEDGRQVGVFPVPADPASLALDRTGALLLLGGQDGFVSVWRTSDGALLARHHAHVGRVAALDVSPDDTVAASVGWDGQVVRWPLDVVRLPLGELVSRSR